MVQGKEKKPSKANRAGKEITLPKRIRERLQEINDNALFLIDAIGQPIFVKDSLHRYVLVNKAYTEVVGFSRKQLLGKTGSGLFSKSQLEEMFARDDEVLATGEAYIGEMPSRGAGDEMFISIIMTLFVDKNGHKYVVGTFRDITEHKRMQEIEKEAAVALALAKTERRKAAELKKLNRSLEYEIKERKQIEAELKRYQEHLEELVNERTRELEDANQKLQKLATTDPLTGAYNRRFFLEAGEREMAISYRTGRPFSLVMFDLDHFKLVNDQYGHQVGDQVLKSIVEKIKVNIRLGDILGRLGGEEFYILLPDTPVHTALEAAERFRELIEKPELLRDGEPNISITASFGVCQFIQGERDFEDCLQRADVALYKAKELGRNRVEKV
jgi:diguanylate cyclase (GGDEF)-like protein/PAS domain S-box-containing protein